MRRLAWIFTLAALGAVLLGVLATSRTRRDPFGTIGRPLPLFLPLEELFTEEMIDSGCQPILCLASCDEWDTGYLCWGKAIYERYDYDGEGRHDLPIQVDVAVDCSMILFGTKRCTAADTAIGEGREKAEDDCWLSAILNLKGPAGVDGGDCACTEL